MAQSKDSGHIYSPLKIPFFLPHKTKKPPIIPSSLRQRYEHIIKIHNFVMFQSVAQIYRQKNKNRLPTCLMPTYIFSKLPQAVGDACLSAFVFTSGKKLIITCLKIHWEGGHVRVE